MIYITGDTHRNFSRVEQFCNKIGTTKQDILIILGDAGINYSGKESDNYLKGLLAELPITLFCIHGNHEQRPEHISSYEITYFLGGQVYVEREFPNLVFAKDGEIYDIEGQKTIVIGGAYSIDKEIRLLRGYNWWEDEQPSQEIKERVEQNLAQSGWFVDIVLSHTCPLKYEPTEMFLSGFDQDEIDKSTEQWLDSIEDRLSYKKWYCGHYHTDKKVDSIEFLYESFLIINKPKIS